MSRLRPTFLLTGVLSLIAGGLVAQEFGANTSPGVTSNAPTHAVTPDTPAGPFDPVAAAKGLWLMPLDRERAFRGIFPRTSDPKINAVLADPDLILYTDKEMPLVRQNWSQVSSGIHSIAYDISGGIDKFGRGSSHEFPWADPAGTHLIPAGEIVEVRAMLLPKSNGKPLPIVYWLAAQDSHPRMDIGRPTKIEWVYPQGTVFLELLGSKLSNGNTVPFELRVRTREKSSWAVDVFRPYTHWEDLSVAMSALGDQSEARRLALRPVIQSETMYDRIHANEHEINLTANYEQLPAYSDATVEKLIQGRTFESALGEDWRDGVAAPAGGFNPMDYRAIMSVDRQSCARCHASTNRHVSHFQMQRDWYGNVRGSDHILSFHVFDPSCVSHNGMSRRVAYRRELIRWKLLEHYDGAKHPNSIYSALE